MGRGWGGSSPWRRWHELGGRVLVSVYKQQRKGQQQESSISPLFILSYAARGAATICRAFPSKCGTSTFLGGVNAVSHSRHVRQQQPNFPRRAFSSTFECPGRNGNGTVESFPRLQNGAVDLETLGLLPHLKSQRPGLSLVQNYCQPRGISTAITAGCAGGAEQPSTDIGDKEPVHRIFPSHNNFTSPKPVKRALGGVSIANSILDSGIDVPFLSRASKLPLHSALPSLRAHRLGDSTFAGLQSLEAAASLPVGDTVDWHQQRLGNVRNQDSRYKQQPLPPPADAEPDDIFIPVKAFYISRSVDLKSLAREPFLEVTPSRNNLIIRCADRPPHSPVTADNPEMACLGFLKERFMVAFQYGSVVFFNFGDLEEVESLDIVRKYCSDEFRETRKDAKVTTPLRDAVKGTSFRDDAMRGPGSHAIKKHRILYYGVLVRPTLPEWSEGGHDRVMLRKLDLDNIRVISSILGQSIALDHYAKRVDEMVTTFSELNRGMEQTGTFTMTRKSLFQLVAAANTTLADVILRLGLLERSDAAWKDANYAQIWEYLREDFELDERFESLDFKLNIIQHNVRFFLEILQNRKSDTLEWIIILLITGEICVSLYDILHTAGAI